MASRTTCAFLQTEEEQVNAACKKELRTSVEKK